MTVNSIRCRPLLLDLARTSRSIAQGTSHGCLCLLFSRLRSHVLSRSWLTLISRHCRVQTYFAAYSGVSKVRVQRTVSRKSITFQQRIKASL
ncbi:hypothetical protein CSPX01_14376 [Colletotrichum filicis]|nr:hypothetical protein CSPX01_14376 [Colletotrichum filicis]